jgi:hypothetical protein
MAMQGFVESCSLVLYKRLPHLITEVALRADSIALSEYRAAPLDGLRSNMDLSRLDIERSLGIPAGDVGFKGHLEGSPRLGGLCTGEASKRSTLMTAHSKSPLSLPFWMTSPCSQDLPRGSRAPLTPPSMLKPDKLNHCQGVAQGLPTCCVP